MVAGGGQPPVSSAPEFEPRWGAGIVREEKLRRPSRARIRGAPPTGGSHPRPLSLGPSGLIATCIRRSLACRPAEGPYADRSTHPDCPVA